MTRVENSGILNIRVTWTAPTQPNGVITGYEVSAAHVVIML